MKLTKSKLKEIVKECIEEMMTSRLDEGKSKFNVKDDKDLAKMEQLVKKDRFLKKAFKNLRGKEEKRYEQLFHTFVKGDRDYEKDYNKL